MLTACKQQPSLPKTSIPFQLYLPAEDDPAFDLKKYFHQAANFIRDCLRRTSVMVHCLAGVSRSVSLVLAYLMKWEGMELDEAMALVKLGRKTACPNEGFIRQLREFESEVAGEREKIRKEKERERERARFKEGERQEEEKEKLKEKARQK